MCIVMGADTATIPSLRQAPDVGGNFNGAFRLMKKTIKYTCSCCGKVHEEWPAIAFDSPTAYDVLSDQLKKDIAELTSDFCIIHHPEQTDRFIRATLTQKIIDHCEDLEYGIWVSMSETSFQDYSDNFDNPDYETKYFGWLSNNVPEYDFINGIPTTVFTRTNKQRPDIVPHQDFEHPFVFDYYNGITKAEAEKRIRNILKAVDERDKVNSESKPWWKFW